MHPLLQQNDAVGDIFFDAVPGQSAVAAFRRDDRRQVMLFQPMQQAAQFRAQDGVVRDAREQRIDTVEHDALRPHRLHRVSEANEQSLQIIFAGFVNFLAIDVQIIGGQQLALLQVVQIDPKRRAVELDFLDPFLE